MRLGDGNVAAEVAAESSGGSARGEIEQDGEAAAVGIVHFRSKSFDHSDLHATHWRTRVGHG